MDGVLNNVAEPLIGNSFLALHKGLMDVLNHRRTEAITFEQQVKQWLAATPDMSRSATISVFCDMLEKLPSQYDECFWGVKFWAMESGWDFNRDCPEVEAVAKWNDTTTSEELKREGLLLMRKVWTFDQIHRCVEELIVDGLDFQVDLTTTKL